MNRAQRRKLGIKKEPDLDKKMVTTWNVVVREKEGKVNLYCPTCWDESHKLIAQMKEEMNENKNKKTTP